MLSFFVVGLLIPFAIGLITGCAEWCGKGAPVAVITFVAIFLGGVAGVLYLPGVAAQGTSLDLLSGVGMSLGALSYWVGLVPPWLTGGRNKKS